jgi:hypothetical protein
MYVSMRKIKDWSNHKFGRLLVLKELNKIKKHRRWLCQCDCGKIVEKFQSNLMGNTVSCGCYRNECTRIRRWQGYEGLGKTFYSRLKRDAANRNISWNLSIEFCWELFLKQNKKCAITNVDLEFKRSFKEIDNAKKQNISLDRIDSSLGYIEGNVQWVHKDINVMKWIFSMEKFHYLCKLVMANEENYIKTYGITRCIDRAHDFGPRINLT